LSPIKHCRELDPLDSALNSKPQEKAVEMSFDGSLGYVQIASDLRVVTPLQKKVDDLLFPWSYLSKIIFHALHLMDCASWVASGTTAPQVRSANPEFGS
jgi:hypothetical protein